MDWMLELDDWVPDDGEMLHQDQPPPPPESRRHDVHCLCGRFARCGGARYYYNGWFDCYSFDVICSRCGVVTIECV